jgi:hypothetical protein|tara:strand:- start:1 stop:225 length:225 start_codon:yes stop_codon:yes gene_type:complete
MEKTKYIVSRLVLMALATVAFVIICKGLAIIGKDFGMDPIHIVYGIIGMFTFGMLVFWLGEGYELNKRHKSLDK